MSCTWVVCDAQLVSLSVNRANACRERMPEIRLPMSFYPLSSYPGSPILDHIRVSIMRIGWNPSGIAGSSAQNASAAIWIRCGASLITLETAAAMKPQRQVVRPLGLDVSFLPADYGTVRADDSGKPVSAAAFVPTLRGLGDPRWARRRCSRGRRCLCKQRRASGRDPSRGARSWRRFR